MIGMILPKRVNTSENLGVSSFPCHLVLSLSILSSPFPLPSLGRLHPLNQLGSLGERSKLTQWGLGRSPSRQTIWCISGPKGAALWAPQAHLIILVLCVKTTELN